MTMPARQPVECPRCHTMVDGVHTCSPNIHSPDAGTMAPVDYVAFLHALADDLGDISDEMARDRQEHFLEQRNARILTALATHLMTLRKAGGAGMIHGMVGYAEYYGCAPMLLTRARALAMTVEALIYRHDSDQRWEGSHEIP